jgi:hypothetical protein
MAGSVTGFRAIGEFRKEFSKAGDQTNPLRYAALNNSAKFRISPMKCRKRFELTLRGRANSHDRPFTPPEGWRSEGSTGSTPKKQAPVCLCHDALAEFRA